MSNGRKDEAAEVPRSTSGLLPRRAISILHGSDLHIRPADIESAGEELRIDHPRWTRFWSAAAERHSLVVLTGDISASSPDETAFRALSEDLSSRTSTDGCHRGAIVLPGNHDRRMLGNIGLDESAFDEAFPEWRKPWWSADFALIVVAIDSNPSEREHWYSPLPFARGRVRRTELARVSSDIDAVKRELRAHYTERLAELGDADLKRLALRLQARWLRPQLELLRTEGAANGELRTIREALARTLADLHFATSVKCVALHHHPMGIADTDNGGTTSSDVYLALVNSGEFIHTCRTARVNLLLHGHKHFPYRMLVRMPGNPEAEGGQSIGIVGAGTLLGNEEGHVSFNVIEVSAHGEADARLVEASEAEDHRRDAKGLKVRGWSDVKLELGGVARRLSTISAKELSLFFSVDSSGDAKVTRRYTGIECTSVARAEGALYFPVNWRGGAGGIGTIEVASEKGENSELLGQGDVTSIRYDKRDGSHRGFLRIPVSGDPGSLTLMHSHTRSSSFATNPWQVRCASGARAVTHDFISWVCSLPVLKTTRLHIRFPASVQIKSCRKLVTEVTRIFDGPDGVHHPEVDSVHATVDADRHGISLTAPGPLWGMDYRVEWALADRNAKGGPPHRPWREVVEHVSLDGIAQLFPDCEIVLYEVQLAPYSRGSLVPRSFAGRSLPPSTHWKIGHGVAGRAAWMREETTWFRRGDPQPPYIATGESGRERHAVVALPLVVNDSMVGVLSIAAPTSASATSLRTGLGDELWARCRELAKRVAERCLMDP